MLRPNSFTKITKMTAVKASTVIYLKEILFLQKRHFPKSNKKLKIGILSYHAIGAEQEGHDDRGFTIDFPSSGIR